MRLRIAIGVGVAVLSVAAAVARPLPAAAATPCWKALLNDWYDGRIDGTYALHCYSDALKHLPADVQTYSSAHDDILRALQNAKAQLKKSGTKITETTLVVPPKPPATTTTHRNGNGQGTTTGSTTTTQAPGRKPPQGGLPSAVDKVNHSSPSSVPLPLIVLGALALLLIAAGGIGLIAKRRQGS